MAVWNLLTGHIFSGNELEGLAYNILSMILEGAYRLLGQPSGTGKQLATMIVGTLANFATLNALAEAFKNINDVLGGTLASWVIGSIVGSIMYAMAKLIVDAINFFVKLTHKFLCAMLSLSISWWFGIPVGASLSLSINIDKIL